MPRVFKINGYLVYFWSNENDEPIHVHVSKGKPSSNATKFWLLRNGTFSLVHNNSKISAKDLKHIENAIANNKDEIISKWLQHFGKVTFYSKLEIIEK